MDTGIPVTVTENTRDRWLRPMHRGADSELEVIFLPHAGGSATFFRDLSAQLPEWVDRFAVQYPGRQDRRAERPVDSITGLAERIVEILLPRTGKPLVLFGHSMGAAVAFEVARVLDRRTGPVVAGLVASGRPAPSARPVDGRHPVDDKAIRRELVRHGGTGMAFLRDPELWDMIIPVLRADYRAVGTYEYQPGPPLGCPLSVLVGDSDVSVPVPAARRWQRHTSRGFRLRVFPGGHFYLAEPTPN
ncbi:alpha/beta fold hydrolase [Kibdelosporangium lantanae]